jgi:hypothetical protein
MKRKLIILITTVLILFPVAAWANINVFQVENPPTLETKYSTSTYRGDFTTKEIVDVAVYEINYLQNKFEVLERVNWSVYAISKQCKDKTNKNPISGIGGNGEVYLFMYPGITKEYVSNTVTHELGHTIENEFLNIFSLHGYFKMRDDGETHTGYYDNARELFAEDFRYLFGSERAKNAVDYRPTYPMPGEKEKEWILDNLLVTWQDRLQYYESDHAAGEKEIARAGQLYNERKTRGDIEGAESAHNWADMVREAIGIKTVA